MMNDALCQTLADAKISYEQLAKDVRVVAAEAGEELRTNKSAVAHWVSGRPPKASTSSYIAEAISRRLGRRVTPTELGLAPPDTDQAPSRFGLELGPDALDMLAAIGEADIQRRRFLTTAAYSVVAAALPLGADQAVEWAQRARTGHRAGQAEIDAVRDMTRMLVSIDERHGGQHGRSAVVHYLTTDVTRLCRATFRTTDQQAGMLSTAAAVAYLCGWKSYDAGEHGLAQRYYLQAYQLTREADDDLHSAFILRILAHNGMDIRRPEHTLDLADTALNRVRGKVDPATEALFSITRARALANARRGPEAVSQLRHAQDLALRGDETSLPHFAALWGSARACVSSHTAKTFRALRDHGNAERHYAVAARGRPGPQFARINALTLTAQGRELATLGHVEQACVTWERALGMLDGVRSARAADSVASMRRQLRSLSGRGIGAAGALDERARQWEREHLS
jgi:hypothetical protein